MSLHLSMNKYLFKVIAVWWVMVVSLEACQTKPNSEYERLVQAELSKGERQDSLFLGIHLGMTRKDFFVHCWELNKQYLLQQGPGNLSAEHLIETELRKPAYMRFYPNFIENKIYEMPVEFSYQSWSPWVKETSGDSLLPDVLRMYEKWYGQKFLKMELDGKKDSWVQVRGNRRLIVYRKDTSTVFAKYDDLLLTNELAKRKRKNSSDE